MDTIYVEEEIHNHPRAKSLIKKIKPRRVIFCERYTEIFNRKSQNFRLQKERPALILAKKYGKFLHPIPQSFSIGAKRNFYFSHLLNCPFDCSYCYLQGMYRSAHFVLFINFEDYENAIETETKEYTHFFSGYDADSLALEPKTGFLHHFLPFFEKHPKALLEVRTKSLYLRPFLERTPFENCVVAYTLNPEKIAQEIEKKAPPLKKRIEALKILQDRGWKIGLRFDPLIWVPNFQEEYRPFFHSVFSELKGDIHSVTLGAFRLPKPYYKNMQKIKAAKTQLPLLKEDNGQMRYPKEQEMIEFCKQAIHQYVNPSKVF